MSMIPSQPRLDLAPLLSSVSRLGLLPLTMDTLQVGPELGRSAYAVRVRYGQWFVKGT